MATIKRTQNNPLNHGRASCKKTPELPDFRDSRYSPHFANEAPASDVINNQIASWFTCPALPFGRTKAKIAFGLESLPPVGTQPFRPRDPSHDDFEKFLTGCSLWKKNNNNKKPYTIYKILPDRTPACCINFAFESLHLWILIGYRWWWLLLPDCRWFSFRVSKSPSSGAQQSPKSHNLHR